MIGIERKRKTSNVPEHSREESTYTSMRDKKTKEDIDVIHMRCRHNNERETDDAHMMSPLNNLHYECQEKIRCSINQPMRKVLVTTLSSSKTNWSLYPVLVKRTVHCIQLSKKEPVDMAVSCHTANYDKVY